MKTKKEKEITKHKEKKHYINTIKLYRKKQGTQYVESLEIVYNTTHSYTVYWQQLNIPCLFAGPLGYPVVNYTRPPNAETEGWNLGGAISRLGGHTDTVCYV